MRAGAGHKYWGKLKAKQDEIEATAKKVYLLLFGEFNEIHSQSTDLPRAGEPYAHETMTMLLRMVNIFNEITPAMWEYSEDKPKRKNKTEVEQLPSDEDGSMTLKYLEKIESVARLVADPTYIG